MPVLGEQLAVIEKSLGTPSYARTLARVFPAAPSISIDYGVMEKSQRIAVVPAEFGWSDVGSFAALSEVRELDDLGNVLQGDAIVIDGHDNVVLGHGKRPVAVVGVDGLVVVDAGDAVLVVRKEKAQDVRKAVEELKRRGRELAPLGEGGGRGREHDMAAISKTIFREYDIRGLVDQDLTEDAVRLVGRALGTEVREQGGRRVVVGRDCRESGPRFALAMIDGARPPPAST